ncbi:MAG: hypothetical protein JOY77_04345 [Alphaproteobacteria bacterium]|nr:hypothetical protein [Alphaproteobacteria bacterium]
MVHVVLTVLEWLPVGFDWAILPVGLILTGLAFSARTRPLAATGFLVAAAFSAVLLSIVLATSVFHLLGYGRAVADLLLNFGPAVTRDYVVSLARENGPRLLALVPMIVTTALASIAAIYLRRRRESETDASLASIQHMAE